MTTSSRMLLIVGILAASSSGAAQSGSSERAAKPAFSLTISAPQDVKIGESVILKITLTNISDHDLPAGALVMAPQGEGEPPISLREFDIKLSDSEGKGVRKSDYGMKVRGESPPGGPPRGGVAISTVFRPRRPLKSGESRGEPRDLAQEFDLSKPGKYTVHVERSDPDSKSIVKSNTITVTVTQ